MRCPACHRRLSAGAACPNHPEARAPVVASRPGFLGGGGAGEVWAETRDGLEVAVKVAHHVTAPRFAREAAALRRVGPPAVPSLVEEGHTADGRPVLVLERLIGRTLGDLLAERGALGVDEALARARDMAAALGQVHAAGVVHRDLKPENVFLAGKRTALLDLGLARFTDELETEEAALSLTSTGAVLGTPAYLAPEQAGAARGADARSDIYALGVVLFEMLTGRPPFVGEDALVVQAHLSRRPPRASTLAATVPAWLDDVLLRCLAKDPADRPPNVAAFVELLVETAPAAAAPVAAAPRPQRRMVALLAVAGSVPLPALSSAAAAEGGQLLGLRGERALFGFAAASAAAGVRAALRAARRLPPVQAAIHVAELRVRGAMMLGPAAEKPEAWLPPQRQPIVLTEAASEALGEAGSPSDPGSSAVERTPLRGRDAVLEAARADGATGGPSLTAILGDAGLGKTRALEALAADRPVLTAPPPSGDRESLLRALLRVAFGLSESSSEGEARAAGPLVAYALGLVGPEDPAVAPVLATPGALRQSLAKAGGDALRARAPLALFVDDAHTADPTSLDILEIATLSGHDADLWVCVAASPSLLTQRPTWGSRAGRSSQHVLTPLDETESRALMRDLLASVEFLPDAVIDRLVAMGDGSPLNYVELAVALRTEHLVVATDLLRLGTTPLPERLARRALESLSADLAELAGVVAVLGRPVGAAEIDAVLAAAGIETELDTGVALRKLMQTGVLRAHAGGAVAFRHPMVRDAVETLADPALRRRAHEGAYRVLAAKSDPAVRAHLARHAAASGAHAAAAAAYLDLADEARARSRFLEAEEHYTHALEQPIDDPTRLRALSGRGKVRYRSSSHRAALEDLEAAHTLAERLGDERSALDSKLEVATIRDELGDFHGAAEVADGLAERIRALRDTALEARWLVALGRARLRQDRVSDSIELLMHANDRAATAGDREAQTIALLLLAFLLAYADQPEESEKRFAEVIHLCEQGGDRYHLAGALINRATSLDVTLGRMDRLRNDASRAIEMSREMGNPQKERIATYNLAEKLYYAGDLDDALRLAQRCVELMHQFSADAKSIYEPLLLARVHLARDEFAAAAELLESITSQDQGLSPAVTLVVDFAKMRLRTAPSLADVAELVKTATTLWSGHDVEDACEIVNGCADIADRGGLPTEAEAWRALVPAHCCIRRNRGGVRRNA